MIGVGLCHVLYIFVHVLRVVHGTCVAQLLGSFLISCYSTTCSAVNFMYVARES